jgi:hypothetical protein
MKLRHILLSTLSAVMLAAPFATPSRAMPVPQGSIYRGGGYTIYLVGDQYKGCDAKKRCLTIPKAAGRNEDSTFWKNKGYTYTLSQIHKPQPANSPERAQLTVRNPKGALIVNVVVVFVNHFN